MASMCGAHTLAEARDLRTAVFKYNRDPTDIFRALKCTCVPSKCKGVQYHCSYFPQKLPLFVEGELNIFLKFSLFYLIAPAILVP